VLFGGSALASCEPARAAQNEPDAVQPWVQLPPGPRHFGGDSCASASDDSKGMMASTAPKAIA
jgi:hypothetical protein